MVYNGIEKFSANYKKEWLIEHAHYFILIGIPIFNIL